MKLYARIKYQFNSFTMQEGGNKCISNNFVELKIKILLNFLIFMPAISMVSILISQEYAYDFMYMLFLLIGNLGLVLRICILKSDNDYKRYYLRNISFIFLLLMGIWSILSTIVNCMNFNVWVGDFYRREGFFTYISYLGIYAVSILLFNECYRKKLLYLLVSVSSVLCILTILEFNGFVIPFFASDKAGYSAIFHQFNHFGYYLLMSGMCAAGLFVVEKNRWLKWFAISSFSIIIVTLIINDTFGCYLAMIAGLFFLPVVFMLAKKNLKLNYFIPLLLFVVLTLGMNLITGSVESNMNTLSTDITKIVTQDESSGSAGTGRWVLWINAVEFIKEKPLFGHGLDNLGYLYYPLGVGTDRPHNEYLQHAAQLGIPALIFYLCALASIFINAYKNRENLSSTTLVALCAVAAYLVSACFGNTMYYTTPYFVMLLGMSTKIGKSDSLEEELEK